VQTRRAAVLSAAALAATAAATVATASAGRAAAAAGPPGHGRPRSGEGRGDLVRVTLPAPGGPYPVGTLALRLVDPARRDPWTGRGRRELMVSVRYPAAAVAGFPAAPQMLPGEAAGFVALNGLGDVPADRVDWAATRTRAHTGAPAASGRRPVVLYSPGAGDPRSLGTTLCDDLASRGFVVVMVDHTYDACAVEFPGGRVETSVLPAELAEAVPDPEHPDPVRVAALLRKVLGVRVDDLRFVLDALPAALAAAATGSADLTRTGSRSVTGSGSVAGIMAGTMAGPRARTAADSLRAAADWSRVAAFGQSAGGFAALQATHDDARLLAAADLDGVVAYVQEDSDTGFLSTVAADGLDRPFLLVGSDGNTRRTVPSWDALWRNSRGPRAGFTLHGAAHGSFTDFEVIVPQLARRLGLSEATVARDIGTVPPRRAVAADRALLAAFFGRWLRDEDDHGLLEGRSRRHPDLRPFS
jgi:dienelactone hydrolase